MIAERLAAQLLSGPAARSPEHVVRRLLAVQAQDSRGVRLSVRCRSIGLTANDVDAALTDRRSLLITWLNRGTLHLVEAADYWWLQPLTTPQLATANQRRLRQEGVTPAQAGRGIDVVVGAVESGAPHTRAGLKARLDAAGVPTRGQALVHVLVAASIRGHVVRGPVVDGEQAFVSARTWLGTPPPALGREEALARLARRYLAGHGPATARDLAKWAGVTLGDARLGLGGIDDELTDRGEGLVDLVARDQSADPPPPRLLGPFDPLLLGWVSRDELIGARPITSHPQVATTNGLIRPVALVDGRVVGTWGLADGTVTIRLWAPLTAAVRDALTREAADVLRFLSLPHRDPTIIAAL